MQARILYLLQKKAENQKKFLTLPPFMSENLEFSAEILYNDTGSDGSFVVTPDTNQKKPLCGGMENPYDKCRIPKIIPAPEQHQKRLAGRFRRHLRNV